MSYTMQDAYAGVQYSTQSTAIGDSVPVVQSQPRKRCPWYVRHNHALCFAASFGQVVLYLALSIYFGSSK